MSIQILRTTKHEINSRRIPEDTGKIITVELSVNEEKQIKRLVMRYKYNWRKYGALPLLILQIVSAIWFPNTITGVIVALWVTIPCGIKYVNCHKWLWYPRQLYFGSMGVIIFLSA